MAESKDLCQFYSQGEHTHKIPLSLHAENRHRLAARLTTLCPTNSWVVLRGGTAVNRGSSDVEEEFRQESYFQWAFGVLEPDFYGAIEVSTGRSVLFAPLLPESYATWSGHLLTEEEFRCRYAVDEVRFYQAECPDISNYFVGNNARDLFVLKGKNTDSDLITADAQFTGRDDGFFKVDETLLHRELSELRVIKTEAELEVLRFACKVSSDAHKEVMRKVRPGWYEYQAEALFKHYVYHHGGIRHVAYTCICGSGGNAAILHYGHAAAPNDKLIKDGDMCLFDMGGEYFCYCSDITCSFPVNGVFTEKQKFIYNTVLKANRAVLAAAKPGVVWSDMHKLAERTTLGELKAAGLLQGNIDDMMAVRLGAVFQPHGLGHLIGLDVHDVGGYNGVERLTEPGLRSLRTTRPLIENMVLTIEPGCYFIDHLLNQAMLDDAQRRFLVVDKLNEFRGFGGVRIEDCVVIRPTGGELLNDVPRTVEEIEALMAEARK